MDEKHWERYCTSVDVHNRCAELERKGIKIRGEGFEDDQFNVVAKEWQKPEQALLRRVIRRYADELRRAGFLDPGGKK